MVGEEGEKDVLMLCCNLGCVFSGSVVRVCAAGGGVMQMVGTGGIMTVGSLGAALAGF